MATAHHNENELRMERTKSTDAGVIQDEKPVPKVEKVDYSGAHEKTDPKEIKLVKKLDRWIMVWPPPSVLEAPSL